MNTFNCNTGSGTSTKMGTCDAPESNSRCLCVMQNNICPILEAREAETKALELLRQAGFSFCQELDWLAKSPSGKWIVVEAKSKSRLFHPPPFWGLGLDHSQVFLRKQACEEHSFPCFLIVLCEDTVYGQYLDILLAGKKYITNNNIIVFPVNAYLKGIEAILQTLRDM